MLTAYVKQITNFMGLDYSVHLKKLYLFNFCKQEELCKNMKKYIQNSKLKYWIHGFFLIKKLLIAHDIMYKNLRKI